MPEQFTMTIRTDAETMRKIHLWLCFAGEGPHMTTANFSVSNDDGQSVVLNLKGPDSDKPTYSVKG